jgi:hypothetical protein
MIRQREALTPAWVEAQMRVPAQTRAMPNAFNVENVAISGQSLPIFIQVVRSFLISARILMRRMERLRRRLRALPSGRERRNISMTC